VRDDAAVAAMFDHAQDAHGGVDVLVNNAGIGHRSRADETTRDAWRDVFDVNCGSAFMVAQAAAACMRADRRGGSIINVGSILQSRTMRNVCAYSASKAALDQMTRCLAMEWARDGIRVNALVPGWFETAMTEPFLGARGASVMAASNPMRRLGTGDDLAGAALLLASRAGAFITGASIVVDGGQALV
jgi:2-dehydro-3-deoxy-D-gluconate 5-dehydrogenase